MHIEQPVLADNKKRTLVHFSGITEFVTTVDEGFAHKKWINKHESLGASWNHGSLQTVAATRNCLLFAEPPPHVQKKAEAFQQALMGSDAYRMASEKAASTKRRRVFELDGGDLDLDRYMGQQDECWVRVTRGLQRPVVRLAMSGMMHGGNDEHGFAGIAAIATCCVLLAEQAGCSVEILATYLPHNMLPSLDEAGSVFPIKHADEPFHQNALLALGIPGTFRHYGFGVDNNVISTQIGSGHGYPNPMSKELREHLKVQHVLEVANTSHNQAIFLDEFVKTLHDA